MNEHRALVYVEEDQPAQRQQVAGMVTTVLATYPIYVLVSATDDQIAVLRAAGFRVDVQRDAFQIQLGAFTLDTRNLPQAPPATTHTLAAPAAEDNPYVVIKFIGPIKEEWKAAVSQLGGELLDYVPNNTFVARLPAEAEKQIAALPFVDWVGPYLPEYKISPRLMAAPARGVTQPGAPAVEIDRAMAPLDPEGNLEVMLHQDEWGDEVVQAVVALGGQVVARHPPQVIIVLDPVHVPALAALPAVKWIGIYSPPRVTNDIAAVLTNTAPVRDFSGVVMDGTGEIVAIVDTGLDSGVNNASMHPDFQGRIVRIDAWPNPPAIGRDGNGHGTHVAGSVLGSGAASGGLIRGMASGARLFFQAVGQGGGGLAGIAARGVANLLQDAYTAGARVHSNSWANAPALDRTGRNLLGDYNGNAQVFDTFIVNNKDMVVVIAAGNEGVDFNPVDGRVDGSSVTAPGTAKNCITVGASESMRLAGGFQGTYGGGFNFQEPPGGSKFPNAPTNPDLPSNNPHGLAAFSGRGPTDDGRSKPDLVAPGTNILSCRSRVPGAGVLWGAFNADYTFSGGTSMATPLVAGIAAVLRRFFRTPPPHGLGHTPSAALIKAALINSATPLRGQYRPIELGQPPNPGQVPNQDEGWGIANLREIIQPTPPRRVWLRDEWQDPSKSLTGPGNAPDSPFIFRVTDRTEALKVTLVWTDPPFTAAPPPPQAQPRLINDLDLIVIDPSGTTLPGNGVVGGDRLNNVEEVIIELPQLGEYRIQIRGQNVPQGPQDYALVVSGAFNPPTGGLVIG